MDEDGDAALGMLQRDVARRGVKDRNGRDDGEMKTHREDLDVVSLFYLLP